MSESGSKLAITHPLDDRYGNTRSNRRRTLVIVLASAVAFVIAFTAWVVWAGLDGTNATIVTNDTAHSVIDDRNVDVSFDVTVDRGTAVSCAVQALNDGFAIVGWKLIDLPPSDKATRPFTERVRTTEQASTGLIYRCWLT